MSTVFISVPSVAADGAEGHALVNVSLIACVLSNPNDKTSRIMLGSHLPTTWVTTKLTVEQVRWLITDATNSSK